MNRRLVGALCWVVLGACGVMACGDDDGGSEAAGLVDSILALEAEGDELDCMCFPDPEACPREQPAPGEVACFKQVVSAHEAEFAPELRCQIRKQEHENDCVMQTCDPEPREACEDAFAEDCDDTVAETYEDEIKACSD